jgi:hypothetical protein
MGEPKTSGKVCRFYRIDKKRQRENAGVVVAKGGSGSV